MTSSDPKSKTAMEVDEDDDEEYEYEEIEVEEEVEVEDDEEEEIEYEEVEEEVEYEEVEEEVEVEEEEDEIEYEEVEEEVEEEEEIEYEEVEEEVEYEEIEEEVNDDDDDDEEDKKEVIGDKLAIEVKGDDVIDANSQMDCIEHDMRSRQHSVAIECDRNVSLDTHPIDTTKQGSGDEMLDTSECPITVKSEANIPSDIQASGTIGLDDTSIKSDEQNREGNVTSLSDSGAFNIPKLLEHGVGMPSHHCSGIKEEPESVDKSIPAYVPLKQCSAPDSSNAQMGEDKATGIEVTAATDVEPVDDGNPKTSRSSLQVRHRSPTPGAGYEDGNKRPAVICEYFAKGWCIKGSSCRFLHKGDHVDDHCQKVEEGILASNSKHQLGSGDVAGRSKLPAYFQSDVGRNDDATQLQDLEKNKIALYEKEVVSHISASSQASPCNDKSNSIFDSKEVEGEIFKENYSFDYYNYRETAITGRSGDGSKYRLPPHFGMSETASMRRRYSLDGFDSSGSVPYSSFMSSDQVARWRAASSSYFCCKENTSAACSSSPYVECDASKISHMNTSKGSLISSKYRSSFVPHNWEPSVPFRPSFFIPSMIRTSSDVQYDPLRDSIEQPDVRHLSSHNPPEFPDRRGSIFEDVQSFSGRNTLDTNKNLHHEMKDKNYYGHHNKEVAPADSAAASTSDVQNKNIFEEENSVIPSSVKDMLKASRNAADVNCNLQSDGTGDSKVIGTEKERKLGHLDEEESRVIKYFRSALIEFVKELMKPVWHEGRLSKDVYKVIVQKAEDKILSTLPSDKVPNTSESVKQYLSLSRPKILKLIQAYVDKYGKF